MRKSILSLSVVALAFIATLTSCTDKKTKQEILLHQSATDIYNSVVVPAEKAKNQKIADYVASLPTEQKIAQLFIENLEGCNYFRSYETFGDLNGTNDNTPLVAGGYLYFSYNIADTPEQQKAFNSSVALYAREHGQIPPYLAVDQEGGWVSRLKKLSPKLPSNEDVAKDNTVAEAYNIYKEQALSMKNMGFHMNLAPVIEVCTPDNAQFLDGRSFGNPEQVLNYGRACVNAYENNNIATVVKHFPGNTNTDPHTGLPVITLSEKELFNSIEAFIQVLDYNPEAVLMSHAITTAVDNGVPACLSKVWVTDILRNKLGYEGLIFSDDIFMGALANNGYEPEKAVVMAIEAGIDCIMISEKRFAKAGAILYKKYNEDSRFAEKINTAVERIIKYKVDSGILEL